MITTTVEYGRTVNLGNKESERIGATAMVSADESPHDALEGLRGWVDSEASLRKSALSDTEAVLNRLSSLRYEQGEMGRQVAVMRDTWNKARRFLQTVGLDLPESYGLDDQSAELPF